MMHRGYMLFSVYMIALGICSAPAYATSCAYYLGYISGEAERAYALKNVYHYTPERLERILSLRDEGKALCEAGQDDAGIIILLQSVELINFTRLK